MRLKTNIIILMSGLTLGGILTPTLSVAASSNSNRSVDVYDIKSENGFDSWTPQQIADFFNKKDVTDVELSHDNWNHVTETQIQQVRQKGIAIGKTNLPISDERAGTTKVVKAAIKYILKHKTQVINEVGKIGGSGAKKALAKGFNAVTPKLNKLLKYESLAWGNVQSAFTSALIGSGVKSSLARSVSYWVVEVVKWLV